MAEQLSRFHRPFMLTNGYRVLNFTQTPSVHRCLRSCFIGVGR